MALNTYGDISPRTAGHATKDLLERGQPMAILERFGHVDAQGKNKTTVRKWRRYEALSPATTPLVEGVTPAGKAISYTDIEVTLKQYGDYVELTDVIQDTHEDPVLSEMTQILAEQIVETVELVRYSTLKAGTNVFYSGGVTARASVDGTITRGDLRKIYRSFKKNRAKEISEIIAPTAKVATEPVGKAYFIVGHTDLAADLMNVPGFTPIEKYAAGTKVMDGEVGKVENFRFILNELFAPFLAAGTSGSTYLTNGLSGTGQADVYPMLAFAKNAYAIVPLQGANAVKPMVKNPGAPTQGDELGQRGFVSWKGWQATAILNDAWMARYEVAATANPA
jgi:N4-gp56 family major capsid protein